MTSVGSMPTAPTNPPPAPPAELRIAVAMRGGVSLAVWMGGACSEIVQFRDATPGDGTPYAKLLQILGYDKVTVDVISGTSAGGLNGALLALHLAYGMPFGNGIRDLWLRLGDLEQLTHSPAASQPDSLLLGDQAQGFYGRLRKACHELLDAVPPGVHPERGIRLVLTATRLHPRTVHVHQTQGAPLRASQARAYFRFQHRALNGSEPILTDFPAGAAHAVADRLAYAARTTSSFPGAFAPARIWVSDEDSPPSGRDFAGLSSETGTGDQGGATVELMDGGVLDNIPIAWAVRAIAGAPADRPVDRWLVYLQPVEPQREPTTPVPAKERRVTRLVRLLLATAGRRMDSESLLDDAEELHRALTTARRIRGLAAAGIPSYPAAVLKDPRRIEAYRRLVGLAEGARLAELIQDPTEVLGPDPMPLPGYRPQVTPDVLADLRDAATVSDLAVGNAVPEAIRTPFALARTVALLLDWVRAAEAYGQLPPATSASLRDQLYSARLAAELLVSMRDRMLLRDLDGATTAAQVVDLVRRITWRLAQTVGPDWRIPTPDGWPEWRDEVLRLCEHPLGDQPGWPDSGFTPFWDELTVLGLNIGSVLDPDVPGPPGFDLLRHAMTAATGTTPPTAAGPATPAGVGGVTPLAAAGYPATRLHGMRQALAAAELLLGPIRSDPFTEPSDLKFHAITASRENPVEKLIFGEPLDPAKREDQKLSGNQLSNFAAFLSARWRHTDWTWGRLDAVPSLVQLATADPARLNRYTGDELLSELRDFYLSGPSDQQPTLAARWAELDVRAATARERFTEVVLDRLQGGVLAEELPVLDRLNSRGADKDLPPTPDELTGLPRPNLAKADLIAKVGAETLRTLLRRGHARRTATRVGLVGWRAVQPAGSGIPARLARAAFGLAKPPVLLPVLAAIASPVGAVIAALGAWLLVAAVAGTWSGPVIAPVLAVGFGVVAGVAAWRVTGRLGWTVVVWAGVAAVLLLGGGVALAAGANGLWDSAVPRYTAILLGSLAVIAPFGWLRASRPAGWMLLVLMFVLLFAAGVGLAAVSEPGGTTLGQASGWLGGPFLGLVALYAVLSIPTVLLTWLFPAPAGAASSQPGSAPDQATR
ncbi:MAG TPA: DUF3376 domain-containing protein [Micromonosporaceae bacterium]